MYIVYSGWMLEPAILPIESWTIRWKGKFMDLFVQGFFLIQDQELKVFKIIRHSFHTAASVGISLEQ